MKKSFKILILAVVASFFTAASFSQTVTINADTLKSVQKKNGSEETVQNQNKNQYQYDNQGESKAKGNSQNAGGNQAVKKVNSAKPDWSKVKGARPNIVRPSGSAMPKGAGKPGGAGKFKGGR